ncbi:unnamed protein product [marine sediment metagenome]|uniref:Uncharacterized protein n=1 Tax=marine sediment metagenome TaxID=412755 RepID=X1GK36_9ZZZZ
MAAAIIIEAYGMSKTTAIIKATDPIIGGISIPPVEAQASIAPA